MNETLSHAVPFGFQRSAGISTGLFRLIVLTFLLIFSVCLYAAPEADSAAADSMDHPAAAGNDSLPGDSIRQPPRPTA